MMLANVLEGRILFCCFFLRGFIIFDYNFTIVNLFLNFTRVLAGNSASNGAVVDGRGEDVHTESKKPNRGTLRGKTCKDTFGHM